MFLRHLQTYRFTFLVTVATLACALAPGIASSWTLSFDHLVEGEWWRLWTGHCTHYGASHLFWDLLMFIVLAAACERRHPRQFPLVLLAMMGSLGLAVWTWCPDVGQYRGLSGIDTSLFIWFVADRVHSAWNLGQRFEVGAWLLLVIGLLGKLVFEAATGQTLFVDATEFQPLVESHLAAEFSGAVFGVAATVWKSHSRGDGLSSLSASH